LGRDFDQLKAGLIDFAKRYYPDTYNDFNETSPGMMFIEMSAYVGDILNFYIDSQLRESMLSQARERKNLLELSQAFGYKPKISVPATVPVDFYQWVPPDGNGDPDYTKALKLAPGVTLRSTYNDTEFIVQEEVDFTLDTYYSPRTTTVAQVDASGAVTYFLLKKTYQAVSATVNTLTVDFTDPIKYNKVLLPAEDIIGINDVTDSDGNTWYEVQYLAQDTIFRRIPNNTSLSVSTTDVPFLLKLVRVPRRFITRVTERGLEMQFGAGVSSSPGEELLPTPENIALSLPTGIEVEDHAFDPTSPIFTSAYGQVPNNTTLTVRYLTGGGVIANVPSNTITEITGRQITNGVNNPAVIGSLAVNNPEAASGGRAQESIEEIRQNSLAQFMSQQRAVTREDYILRTYAMPAIYGSVSKAYVTPDDQENLSTAVRGDRIENPLALNMYVLGYDSDKRLTKVNRAIKQNLKNYLSQYRMASDSVNIRDAFIVNIAVNVEILLYPGYNTGEAIANTIKALKDFFDPDRWQINQPIIFGDAFTAIMAVKGVQMVSSFWIENLNNPALGYSPAIYDTVSATKKGILYPSYDPCIFEVKYPDNDIKVRIATL